MEDIDCPLLQRTDRIGNGRVRVSNVVFRNEKGDAVTEAFVGTPLTIELQLQINDKSVDLSTAIVALTFSDSYGNGITGWVSDELQHEFAHAKEGIISLHIPALNLRPQTYALGLQISLGTTDECDFCDKINPAAQLTVLNDAIFTPGVNLKECRGHGILMPAYFD